ncbi:MAG: hypothetical protein M0R17_00290 [Candidatus Omnitrophica bacterium]|jgi:hypothetical protein|nr:hypothetical protein [Candidatus Omnitrophota bacterium]
MNYPKGSDLSLSYFNASALSYFQNGNSSLISDAKVYEVSGVNNSIKTLRYPLLQPLILDGAYLKSFHYDFWSIVGRYMPESTYISNAYIPPELQAKIGLKLLYDNNPNINFSKYKSKQTNPELIGKYNGNYLFEFDYNSIQSALNSLGYTWAKPNTSVHQRGLAIDIRTKSEYFDYVYNIVNWFYINNSDYFNLSGIFIKQSNTELHIEFNDSSLINESEPGHTALLFNESSSTISDFLKNKESKFYEILKQNGHSDLGDSKLPSSMLSKLPASAKKNNSSLAKAIKEMLEDCLSGPDGLLSKYVQTQLEYSTCLANASLGAIKVICEELDTLTGGRASILARDAIESEAIKSSQSNVIKSKLSSFLPISDDDSAALRVKELTTNLSAKLVEKKAEITLAETNISNSKKDTKKTSDSTNSVYDNLRVTNVSSVVDLAYDHFAEISDNNIVNSIEKTITSTYSTTLYNVTTATIIHNLNKTVTVNCTNSSGSTIIPSITVVDSNTIILTFSISFSGTVVIR